MSRAEQSPRARPAVTVSGGAPPPPPPPPRAASPRRRAAGVLVGALALGAAVAVLRPPPAPPVVVTLRVLPERIATSQAGIVVVMVEADNRGPAVVVDGVVVVAEPVRQEPAANGVGRVAAGARGGLAVIVQPDCAILSAPGSRPFSASVTVVLRSDAGARGEVRLDLDEDPAVAARLRTLCGTGPG